MITSTAIGTGGLGRFGNQMFTIAGVIGIATKCNHTYGFPKWKNYDNALFGGSVDDLGEHFVNPLPDDREQKFIEYGYFWGYRDINLPEGNWSINAHLQSPKYFEHCLPLIRETFRMKDEPEQNDYVAIHYRAGDYIDDPKAYHPRQPYSYYYNALAHFPEGSKILVFSDDIKAAKNMFSPWAEFSEGNTTYLEDFKLMKRCKSFIISNSSFSAMAAHLGEHPEKKVVAPKMWFGEQANGMETKDIYAKDWIVI